MASAGLETLGPLCDAAGITPSLLLSTASLPSPQRLSNGFILELCIFSRRTHKKFPLPNVILWLERLGFPSHDDLTLSIQNMWNRKSFLQKSKKSIELSVMLRDTFIPSDWLSNTQLKSHTQLMSPPMSENVENICKQPLKRKMRLDSDKEDNKLKFHLDNKKKKLQSLGDDIVFKKKQLRVHNEKKAHFSPRNVNKREKRSYERIIDLEATVTETKLLSDKLLSDKVNSLQTEKNNLHKQKSRLKVSKRLDCEKINNPLCDSNIIKELNERILYLEDLIDKQSEQPQLVDLKLNDGSYSPDVKICSLALIRREVSTANIRHVIQDVAQHLFGVHIDPKHLPCANTCANWTHEGCEIINNVCADELQNSAWVPGKDGTTRFQQKLLATVVKTSTGNDYILPFSRVVSETGEAIANDLIEKVEELAVHADDAEVYKEKVAGNNIDKALNCTF